MGLFNRGAVPLLHLLEIRGFLAVNRDILDCISVKDPVDDSWIVRGDLYPDYPLSINVGYDSNCPSFFLAESNFGEFGHFVQNVHNRASGRTGLFAKITLDVSRTPLEVGTFPEIVDGHPEDFSICGREEEFLGTASLDCHLKYR